MSPASVRHIMPAPPTDQRHSAAEDVYAMLIGVVLIVLGIVVLRTAGLVTGGIAGVALLVSYLVPLAPGTLFTLINIPFFVFARFVMGTGFMLKTAMVSTGVTMLALVMPRLFHLQWVNPPFAAVLGGTAIGMGILALARHNAGVGGTGVVTLWLFRRHGLNAGKAQLVIDAGILAASLLVVPPGRVLLSAVSAAAISGVLIAFHRPGRYAGY